MTTETTNPLLANPLLDFSGLPRFDKIRPEHVTPAIEQLIAEARTAVTQAEAPAQGAVTWDNFVVPLEEATERLGRALKARLDAGW